VAGLDPAAVAETNNGGETVENTLRMVDPNVAFRAVHTWRGKVVRAEPVATLHESRPPNGSIRPFSATQPSRWEWLFLPRGGHS
jgi:phage terminase large subunit-like protein